jgi:hypothetical protein
LALRIARAKRVNATTADVLWGFNLPCLGSDAGLEALELMLEANKVGLVIIDPVYMSLTGPETKGLNTGNLFDMGPLLRGIVEACKRQNATPLLIHHNRKNSANEKFAPPDLAEMSGAGFAEFCRQWILLSRRKEYASDGRHELWMQIGGSAGHSSLWALEIDEGKIDDPDGRRWDVKLMPGHEARAGDQEAKRAAREALKNERLEGNCSAACVALAKLPDQTGSKTRIRDAAGLNSGGIDLVITQLLSRGRIESVEFRNPGNKKLTQGYKLVAG